MTNPTQLIAKYRPLIAFLDTQEGCPKVPGYCLPPSSGRNGKSCIADDTKMLRVINPAAVLDSLTVWVEKQVAPWGIREGHWDQACVLCWDVNKKLFETRLSFPDRDRCSECGKHLTPSNISIEFEDGVEATLALLTAICETLGWEGEG